MESDILREFGTEGLPPLHHKPLIIIRDSPSYVDFSERASMENITNQFPRNFQITLSSSNSFSANRRTISLEQYLKETGETQVLPHQLSNQTWYLFGETFTKEWKQFLSYYTLPKCVACIRDRVALSFGIGGAGSGVQWHTHGPGFSESIHGRKHWILYPPEFQPVYNPDFTSLHWMEYTYPTLLDFDSARISQRHKPFECTLYPNEMIYFPNHWHHATINLDKYTAFVSTFTQEHEFMHLDFEVDL